MSITDFFAGCWGCWSFRLRVVSGLVTGVGVNGPRNALTRNRRLCPSTFGAKGERAGAGEVQVNGPVFRNVERTGKLNTALGFDGEKTRSESLSDSGVDRG